MKKSPNDRVRTLYTTKTGAWVKIDTLPMDIMGARFIRFGITVGTKVKCIERLPGGTIVIQKHRQLIAIGHTLAKQIVVTILNPGS